MDTIEIGWSGELGINVKSSILTTLDRCGATTKFFERGRKRALTRRAGYRMFRGCSFEGKSLAVAYEPLFRANYQPSEILLCFHMSHFRNLKEVCNWLHKLMGPSYQDLPRANIFRLDMCIDLDIPFEIISGGMLVPRSIRYFECLGTNQKREIVFGNWPRKTIAYDKKVMAHEIDNSLSQTPDENNAIDAVRIEVRTKGKKCPITSIKDLDNLWSINPFHRIEFKAVDETLVAVAPTKTRQVLESYLYHKMMTNAETARKRMNVHKNFPKLSKKYLKPVLIDTNKAWQERLSRFIGQRPFDFKDIDGELIPDEMFDSSLFPPMDENFDPSASFDDMPDCDEMYFDESEIPFAFSEPSETPE